MKQKILDVLIPAALLAILGTGLTTWREVGILQAEISHLQFEISLLRKFVGSNDPKVFQEAKREIEQDNAKH